MGYKLFLDDVRNPVHCISYMHLRIGRRNPIYLENDWVICRNYKSFVNTIEEMGLPDFISFDHDLADEHYITVSESGSIEYESYIEKTGYECAKWLVNYCLDHKLQIPDYTVHSDNPVGASNIMSYLKGAEKWTKVPKN
jgi:hypothetical protein